MYLARFESGNGDFLSAAFRWSVPDRVVVPDSWSRQLLAQDDLDLALRIAFEPSGPYAVLMLTASVTEEPRLRAWCDGFLQVGGPSGLVVPSNADEFDALTGGLPTWQMRVNCEGYHHGGIPLACDFRLYAMLAGRLDALPTVYQVHLSAFRPDAEVERRVRKYLAWLDLDEPFSAPVRAMQRTLLLRLLQRGWLASEYFAVSEQTSMNQWLERIQTHFNETTGRIGFSEAPVETGDFNDWLASGCHPVRNAETEPSLPCMAASAFGEDETALLLSANLTQRSDAGHRASHPRAHPDVFISYASSDFAHASAVCQHLESNGVVCWMAPRDVDRDVLPYPEAIQRALAQARVVVVMLSDTANHSVHIPRELDLALERRLAIVPIRICNVLPEGQLNYLLRTCQWLNAFNREFVDAMNELLTRLRNVLG